MRRLYALAQTVCPGCAWLPGSMSGIWEIAVLYPSPTEASVTTPPVLLFGYEPMSYEMELLQT